MSRVCDWWMEHIDSFSDEDLSVKFGLTKEQIKEYREIFSDKGKG